MLPMTISLNSMSAVLCSQPFEVSGFGGIKMSTSSKASLFIDQRYLVVFLKNQTIITDVGHEVVSASIWSTPRGNWIGVWMANSGKLLIQVLEVSPQQSVLIRHGYF